MKHIHLMRKIAMKISPSFSVRFIKLQGRLFKNLLQSLLILISVLLVASCAKETPEDVPDLTYDISGYEVVDPDPDMAFSPYIAGRYLRIIEDENKMYATNTDLLSMKGVIIPEGDDFVPGNFSFGYPVAAINNSTIIISTQRKLVAGQVDDHSGSGQFFIKSDNYGEDWGGITELQELQPYGYEIGGLSCIGTYNGKFIQKAFGTLISDDNGNNWSSYARAFKYISQDDWSMYGLNSPQMLDHPEFGLIFFTGTTSSQDTGSVFVSTDGGESWVDDFVSYSGVDEVSCMTPSVMILDDGNILMVSSDGDNMVQYFYEFQNGDTYSDIVFEVAVIENIFNSTNDFAELILNPVNGRIEMLEGSALILNLWSIAVNEIDQGDVRWTKECTLLERQTGLAPMHPAGSVVDLTNEVQRIFVYIGGEYPDRNCIFQIIRSLDTETLSPWINDLRGTG